jgi:hypothetical protein
MNRRHLLQSSIVLAVGSSLRPLGAVAGEAETLRRLVWSSAHCAGCGEAFDEPESLARTEREGPFWGSVANFMFGRRAPETLCCPELKRF